MTVATQEHAKTLDEYIVPSPSFQRATHLRYDFGSPDAIERYIPTTNAVQAIESILSGTSEESSQRSHVLHAAYGSGKSLLAVALSALLENYESHSSSTGILTERINNVDLGTGAIVQEYRDRAKQLPVILVGDEGDISTALPRALNRSLSSHNIDINLQTRFEAAIEVLALWKSEYPETNSRLIELLNERGQSHNDFTDELSNHKKKSIDTFEKIYPILSAGASFDQFYGQSPVLVFRDVAASIHEFGYSGIVIFWDEFGRYLEARTTKAFGVEAALLQDFAEACNYSGSDQLHLLLFAHKELQAYASNLPKDYRQEWSRIEGRFQRHNISSDPQIVHRLIANSFTTNPPDVARKYISKSQSKKLVNRSIDAHLFGLISPGQIEELIIDTWPLHPLTLYALSALSNRVAQNERTMFTFMTSDEPAALSGILRAGDTSDKNHLVLPYELWDYFQEAIRSDTGLGGASRIWSGVLHALDKVQPGDLFTESIVKALGVLLVCSEGGVVKPTTDLVCWSVGADTDDTRAAVVASLENLRRRKVVIHREIDGYWTFSAGSDIDFETKLAEILERTNPSPLQLRRLLQQFTPAPYTLARRYNQEYSMTRFFTGEYRWPSELEGLHPEALINGHEKRDGVVVYLLSSDELYNDRSNLTIAPLDQVVYVLPSEPMVSIVDSLRELFGLEELRNDPGVLLQEDRGRVQRELEWLIEDSQARIRRELYALFDHRQQNPHWIYSNSGNLSPSSRDLPTKIVSDICAAVFPNTPEFNNEGLNKQKPTTQQTRALTNVIDAMLTRSPSEQLELTGHGPDVLALETMLKLPGILQPQGDSWIIKKPKNNARLGEIWNVIEDYVNSCRVQGGKSIAPLLDQLTDPPYGLTCWYFARSSGCGSSKMA